MSKLHNSVTDLATLSSHCKLNVSRTEPLKMQQPRQKLPYQHSSSYLIVITLVAFGQLRVWKRSKRGGFKYFKRGPYIFEMFGLGGPNISKYLDRGEQKEGGPNLS